MRILIAYDDTECSQDMLVDLMQAGLPATAHADVVSFAGAPVSEPEAACMEAAGAGRAESIDSGTGLRRVSVAGLFQRAIALSQRGREQVRRIFAGWSVSSQAYATSATWGTTGLAREWYPDLVVVGCDCSSPHGRLAPGSASRILLVESPCSVRIGRAPYGPQAGGLRILVAVDGSAESDAAVRSIAARRWPAGTAVQVIAVDEPGSDATGLHERAMAAAAEMRAALIPVRCTLGDGDPAAAILEEAACWAADMIFIGARGDRSRDLRGIGSVAERVATEAHCSVEVVRVG